MLALRWTLGILGGLVLYEILRAIAVKRVRGALQARVRRFLQSRDVRLDRFKLGTELWVREELLNDLVIAEAILARARETGRPPEDLRREVESWIEEIVPRFSLISYYQLGSRLARAGINALYTPLLDRESARAARRVPENASVIYVANHRSNADYVLLAYFLLESVSVSYAVGEWARVWPLDALFKSFGGYFVRRGFREPLYHKVLERYVQLITRRGVTQGIFLEGGLSRDGALRAPKCGLLESVMKLFEDPRFDKDVVLVPVGLNFDHVLEDRALVAEGKAKDARPPSTAAKLWSGLKLLAAAPFVLATNAARAATGRLRRLGYASASFGAPYSLRERLAKLPGGRLPADPDARRTFVRQVADEVMREVARLIPATPVPLVARALESLPPESTVKDVEAGVAKALREVAEAGGRVVLGGEFAHITDRKAALDDEAEGRKSKEMLEVDSTILHLEEAEGIARKGLEILRRRGLCQVRARTVRVPEGAKDILSYYARSLDAFPRLEKAARVA